MSLSNIPDDLIQQVLVSWATTSDTNLRIGPKDYQVMSQCSSLFLQFVEANPDRAARFNQTIQQLQ